ncbi:hypothetical protein [Streptomyces tubercidicus]|uniref:Uncharacterized protein n=1 Tax=Streptomyces tubercidicus TaxID=47759 RepID=A0A640ULF5_9ACTN|nr:hypothetical protein [Streptomyces tubercidicus]WAU11571.1 hypothetical protein STRTU_001803 [Streptomyces tubercidicus]GFE36873.1 hypothetical protein Stube_15460 [Streptomyces tubercidicus]
MEWRDFAVRGPAGRRPRTVPGRRISAAGAVSGAVVGGLWWWAAVRLVVWPQSAGVVEGAVLLGGWGLSLLPVHCVPRTNRNDGICRRAMERAARRVREGRGAGRGPFTRAWRRRRSGGGPGRS